MIPQCSGHFKVCIIQWAWAMPKEIMQKRKSTQIYNTVYSCTIDRKTKINQIETAQVSNCSGMVMETGMLTVEHYTVLPE